MSNEILGISGVFLLTLALLLLRHGLMMIGRRKQKTQGGYHLRSGPNNRRLDPGPEPNSEEDFYHNVEASLVILAAPVELRQLRRRDSPRFTGDGEAKRRS